MRVVNILVTLGALFLSFILIKNILGVLNIQERVREAKKEVVGLDEEQEELKRRLEFATSSAFIERTAREKLGLGKPGEYVVVLPQEEFLKSLAPSPEEEEKLPEEPNWKKWLKIFF